MGCAYRSRDGICLRGRINHKCVEHRCVHWRGDEDRSTPKEENYQAYIDELHKGIETLYETITEQANRLDEYEQAMIDAFKKWSRI